MKVNLIANTKGAGKLIAELGREPNGQEVTGYITRVSNPNNQLNMDTVPKLLAYCIKHKHWSPFEHAYMTLEIETSRAIAAQILRHRSFTFQEFCMSGDTMVYFDLPANLKLGKRRLYKLSLKDLWEKWNGYDGLGNPLKNRIKEMNVRVYDEITKTFKNSKIKEVFNTGKKEIYEIELENGKKIKSTKEHRVLTKDGFQSLEQAFGLGRKGDTAYILRNGFIGCNGTPLYKGNTLTVEWAKIKKVTYLGVFDTYDLEIEGPSHNYVADGVVVHNSQRYSVATEFEIYPARRQDVKNKQNSIDDMSDEDKDWFEKAQQSVIDASDYYYKEALKRGIAKEQARFLLPLSTKTTIYMTGNLRSWIHYIELRTDKSTQLEHREIALECKRIFKEEYPDIAEALGW